MGKPYSEDLRKRVVAAVETGGLSCNQAAKQFGVAISTAINWVRRLRETGSVAPGKMDRVFWLCNGQVDIATAQQAIATDWIAAYRKYYEAR